MDDLVHNSKPHWAVMESGNVYCTNCKYVSGRTNFVSRLMTAELMKRICPNCGCEMDGFYYLYLDI